MSRIGQSPVNLKENVEVIFDNKLLKFKGPKGLLEMEISNSVDLKINDNNILVEHACEMSCACTTCHCIIRKGFDSLDEASDMEEDLLDKAWGLEQTSRLSCQTIPPDNEEIEIELPKYNINMVSEDH